MKLIYKIEFNSTNTYYKIILEDFIKICSINGECKQFLGFILIIIEDDSEKIKEFFQFLELQLPLSIFLGKSYVIDSYDTKLKEIKDNQISQNIALLSNRKIKNILDTNEIDFLNDILVLANKGVSTIKTHNGLKEFYLSNQKLREKFEHKGFESYLLFTDISKIENLCEISKKDFELLCSIERPLVKLKFKLGQNINKEYSSTNFIYAQLPDDKETILFADALKNNDIPYILFVNSDVYQENIKVFSFKDNNILISGDKGIFPKFDYRANKRFTSSQEYFAENLGVYNSILAQYEKRLIPAIGIYFSLNSTNSSISINIPQKGLKEVILIPNIENSIENCLEEIGNIDENAKRLIQNYKKRFYKKLLEDVPLNSKGFLSILNICSKIIGLNNAKEFGDLALGSSIKSALQVDMKLIKIAGKNYLDYRKIVQSIMSYKLADVDNETLAYSFYESLSEFIVVMVEEIVKDFKVKDIVFCGDMFSNTIFLDKSYKSLNKSYSILLSKEYPLDYSIVNL